MTDPPKTQTQIKRRTNTLGATISNASADRGQDQGQDRGQDRSLAGRFGALVRERRKALGINQDALALATGVGRRFIIDLEAGKPNCQLGKSLMVAQAVGLRLFDVLVEDKTDNAMLPAMSDDDGPP